MTSCELLKWVVAIETFAIVGITCWAMVLDTKLEQRNNYIERISNDLTNVG